MDEHAYKLWRHVTEIECFLVIPKNFDLTLF